MSYQLVFAEQTQTGDRDVGENVFLSDLPNACQVFAFYYPSAAPDPALEDALRELGKLTGHNLFVNIGRLNDPSLAKIVSTFAIEKYPVIVITGTPDVASSSDDSLSAFVRLDNPKLLGDPSQTVSLLNELFSLFLSLDPPIRFRWRDGLEFGRVRLSWRVPGWREDVLVQRSCSVWLSA